MLESFPPAPQFRGPKGLSRRRQRRVAAAEASFMDPSTSDAIRFIAKIVLSALMKVAFGHLMVQESNERLQSAAQPSCRSQEDV